MKIAALGVECDTSWSLSALSIVKKNTAIYSRGAVDGGVNSKPVSCFVIRPAILFRSKGRAGLVMDCLARKHPNEP
jgi:hypothetical protein